VEGAVLVRHLSGERECLTAQGKSGNLRQKEEDLEGKKRAKGNSRIKRGSKSRETLRHLGLHRDIRELLRIQQRRKRDVYFTGVGKGG